MKVVVVVVVILLQVEAKLKERRNNHGVSDEAEPIAILPFRSFKVTTSHVITIE